MRDLSRPSGPAGTGPSGPAGVRPGGPTVFAEDLEDGPDGLDGFEDPGLPPDF